MTLTRALLLAVIVLALIPLAAADTIGPGCATCQGSTYTLTYNPTPISSTATTQTFQFTYTIDTSTFSGSQPAYIDNVGLKISSANLNAVLVSAPGGIGSWAVTLGTLNAKGCRDNAGDPFACAGALELSASNLVVTGTPGGTYTWVFEITVQTGTLLLGENASSIKARYVDGSGRKIGPLLSEGITLTPVPEPSSVLLLSGGLIALVGLRKRISVS